ncbi:hypothetical protein ACIPY6_40615 [Streptomyces sp. NPDC090054]|uniref:hypothetical protein n=1 Tax=Streptomyces sp. NPDC090054 TaxID=3365933 RepID=UPI00382C9905
MDDATMPPGLVCGINATITEAVKSLTEVTRYANGGNPFDVPRMLLYRLGDAIDSLSQISRIVALHYREEGRAEHDLTSYLQPRQERARTAAPDESDRAFLAGLLGRPQTEPDETGMYLWGKSIADHSGTEPQEITMQAVLYALSSQPDEDLSYSLGDLQGPRRELALQLLPLLAQKEGVEEPVRA